MDPITRRWQRALITGASSGIGREMARRLAGEGTSLVVVARDSERLEALAEELTVPVEVLPADLSQPGDVDKVADRLRATVEPVDLLINNAGLGFTGPFLETSIERHKLVVDVNVVAPTVLSHAAGEAMSARGGGTILNVSSIAGDLPGPMSATYNATKSFVTSLSQSLHIEYGSDRVVVSCLCPGLTRTEFQDRAEYDTSEIPAFLWQSAEEVAAAGLDAAAGGHVVAVPGGINKVWSRAIRSSPRGMARQLAVLMNRK